MIACVDHTLGLCCELIWTIWPDNRCFPYILSNWFYAINSHQFLKCKYILENSTKMTIYNALNFKSNGHRLKNQSSSLNQSVDQSWDWPWVLALSYSYSRRNGKGTYRRMVKLLPLGWDISTHVSLSPAAVIKFLLILDLYLHVVLDILYKSMDNWCW